MIVRAAPPEHYPWIQERCGMELTSGFRAIEAVNSGGRIVGMVGYSGWTPASCWMHVALEHPVRELLRPAFEWPFIYGERKQVLGLVAGTNRNSANLAHKLGFKELARIPGGWDTGADLIVYRMTRRECRWIESSTRRVA